MMKKLFDAINKGDIDTVRVIIDQNKTLLCSREKGWRKRDEGETPLRIAIKNCRYDIVRFLINAGADVNDYTPRDGLYISHQAVYTAVLHSIPGYQSQIGTYQDSFDILKYLVRHQMDINLQDNNGVNCFYHGINLSHSMMHSTSNMFDSELVDTLAWNPKFDVTIAYENFKGIFTLLLEGGVNTAVPDYWREQSAYWEGFNAKIKWTENILNLCKK